MLSERVTNECVATRISTGEALLKWILQAQIGQVSNRFGTVCILGDCLRGHTVKESEEVW